MDENNKINSIIVPIIKALLISLTIIGVLTFYSDCHYKNSGKFPIVNSKETIDHGIYDYTDYTYGVFLSAADRSHEIILLDADSVKIGKQEIELYLDIRNILVDGLICIVVLSICILKYLNSVNLVNAKDIEDTDTDTGTGTGTDTGIDDVEDTNISAKDIDAKVATKTYSKKFIVGIKSFMISFVVVIIGTLYSFTPGSLLCIIPLPIQQCSIGAFVGEEEVYLFVTRYIGRFGGIIPSPVETYLFISVANIIMDILIVVLSVVISVLIYKKKAKKIVNIQETE